MSDPFPMHEAGRPSYTGHSKPRWWLIREDELLHAIQRAFHKTLPGVVMLELLANSERIEDSDGSV